jgi:hypothetical protein
VRVGQMMETEAAREPEEGKPRRKSMSIEDLRKRYSTHGGQKEVAKRSNPAPSLTWKQEEKTVLP